MVSDEAKERVLNSLVKNLKNHEDVSNAEIVDIRKSRIELYLERLSDNLDQQLVDLIENTKEYYQYNKEKYIPKVSPSDYRGRDFEVEVKVIVVKKRD